MLMVTSGANLRSSNIPTLLPISSNLYLGQSHRSNVPHIFGVRRWLFVLADFCGVWSSALLIVALRFAASARLSPVSRVIGSHLSFLLLYSVLIVLLSNAQGLYSAYQFASRGRELMAVAKSVVVATLLVISTIYASGLKDISRLVIGCTAVSSFLTMAGWRQCRRRALGSAVADGLTCHNVLIIGTDSLAHALRDHLVSQPQLGFVVLGLLRAGELDRHGHQAAPGAHEIGTLADLPRICRTQFIDEIIVCAQQRQVVKAVIGNAREYGVGVRVVPDLYDGMAWGAHLDYLGAFPTLGIVHREIPTVKLKVKRALDVAASGAALILLSPLMLLIAILIKLDSRGSVFYVSQRVGKKGRIFSCYKFRTMVSNAEQLKTNLEHLNERDGIIFKIRCDPRVTRAGRYLRKYSLDELAQLWNVLRGEMSLVGPRPPLASEVDQYELEYYRRLEAAPGITGLWQVEARTSPCFQEYISLDLSYVKNWSLLLDLNILLRTVAVVVAGSGS